MEKTPWHDGQVSVSHQGDMVEKSGRIRLRQVRKLLGGLTEGECHELVETIQRIHASGTTIVWIEHIVHALIAVVSRIMAMSFGRKIAEWGRRVVKGVIFPTEMLIQSFPSRG